MWQLRPTAYDHPDAVGLIAQVQRFYRDRYGGEDDTPIEADQFAELRGGFVVGYLDGVAVACGGWRARDRRDDPELRDGDAEIKRMYVTIEQRGRGYARAVLAELEAAAAAVGRRRAVLETGTRQPEAIGLYTCSGYRPIPPFGLYRDSPNCRCYAKLLPFGTVDRHRSAAGASAIRLGGE